MSKSAVSCIRRTSNGVKPLIVANWKMNPQSLREAKLLWGSIRRFKKGDIVICPPFVYLSVLKINGAQDCSWEEKGAYTGEISPLMLRDLGVEYVILGHSERRKYQKETDLMIEKKLRAAMRSGLMPILCIDKISQIPKKIKRGYILAYEPLFAIGTGKPCSIVMARKMRNLIKKKVKNIPTLYGGNVTSLNARGYVKEAGFQGLLVGGASLKPKEFIDIIKAVC